MPRPAVPGGGAAGAGDVGQRRARVDDDGEGFWRGAQEERGGEVAVVVVVFLEVGGGGAKKKRLAGREGEKGNDGEKKKSACLFSLSRASLQLIITRTRSP